MLNKDLYKTRVLSSSSAADCSSHSSQCFLSALPEQTSERMWESEKIFLEKNCKIPKQTQTQGEKKYIGQIGNILKQTQT